MNRRLPLLALFTGIFAVGILIWYFFFATPKQEPTLGTTASPFPSNILPSRFGFITGNNDQPPASNTQTEVTPEVAQPLTKIWEKPATGGVFVTRTILQEVTATSSVGTSTTLTTSSKKQVRTTSNVLMFVDRTTGYIYGHTIETGTTFQISNTTIPGVYDAYIFNDGKRILLRYLDTDRKTILSILGNIPQVQETGNASPLEKIMTLPKNITSVAVSSSLEKISYVVPNTTGSSVYTITSKGQGLTATSFFSEWSLSYGGEQLYATSKPSSYVEGTTVLLPSFTRLIGNKTGLLSNPSSNGTILNSMWSDRGLATFLFSNKGSTVPISIQTIVSKCVWGKGTFLLCAIPQSLSQTTEGLPDDWYQGRVLFSDTLSLVGSTQGETYPLYSFDAKLGDMDVTHLSLSSDNILVNFIRKQDGSLWLLRTNLLSSE